MTFPEITRLLLGVPRPIWTLAAVLAVSLLVFKNFVFFSRASAVLDIPTLLFAGFALASDVIALYLPLK